MENYMLSASSDEGASITISAKEDVEYKTTRNERRLSQMSTPSLFSQDVPDLPAPIQLKRSLGLMDAIFVIVGIMIGSGIFVSPSTVLNSVYNCFGLSLIVWIFGGFLSLLTGLCFAELGAAIPDAGGDFLYLTRGLGRAVGFSFVWAAFWCLKTGSQTIIAIVFGRYLCIAIFEDLEYNGNEDIDSDYRIKLFAVASMVFLSLCNMVSVRLVAIIQSIGMFFKFITVIAVITFAIIGIAISSDVAEENFKNIFEFQPEVDEGGNPIEITWFSLTTAFGIATIAAMWSYEGFTNLNCVAEEVKRPQKNIPKSIIIGVVVVTSVYIIINLSYFCVLPTSQIATSQGIAIEMADKIAGRPGEILMPILISLCAFGALNGSILTSARIFFAAAREGLFPFGRIVSKTNSAQVPWVAVLVQLVVCCLLVIPGNFESLVNYFGFTAWIFNVLVVVCQIRFRFKTSIDKPFRVRPYPLIPFVVIVVGTLIVLSTLIEAFRDSMFAIGFICLGIPVYLLFYWKGNIFVNIYRMYKECQYKHASMKYVGDWGRVGTWADKSATTPLDNSFNKYTSSADIDIVISLSESDRE